LSRALARPVADLWSMRNGYALCTRQGLDLIADHLGAIRPKQAEALAAKLRIGIHRGVAVTDAPDAPWPVVSQAFCSALPGRTWATTVNSRGFDCRPCNEPKGSNSRPWQSRTCRSRSFPRPRLKAAADDVDRRAILQQEKSLLHVAATRAKKLLRVSWSGEPTDLIVAPKSEGKPSPAAA
jgi:hypothetical protein